MNKQMERGRGKRRDGVGRVEEAATFCRIMSEIDSHKLPPT